MRFFVLGVWSVLLTCTGLSFADNKIPRGLLLNEQDTIAVFKARVPFVVNIHRQQVVRRGILSGSSIQESDGTGFLWNRSGYVVTNEHVIHGADRVVVTLPGGQRMVARVVGADPFQDIAVLHVKKAQVLHAALPLASMPLSPTNQIQVGQKTIAIGNAFGLSQTLTTGVVSAKNRELIGPMGLFIPDLIQTDASINPGNSGGPLLDSQGRLIGMNTMIFSRSGGSTGVGFAVPANDIRDVVTQIIKTGRFVRSGIGVQPLSDVVTMQLGFRGVIVGQVMRGGPASLAGMHGTIRTSRGRWRLGDLIVGLDKKTIRRYYDFYEFFKRVKPGQMITVTFIRGNKKHQVQMKSVALTQKPRRVQR